MFYEAQRSGPTPAWNRVSWRGDSHLTDRVPGGWYDAGDFIKLNFPLAPTVSMLAWGMLEFNQAYATANGTTAAKRDLKVAVDYLANSYDSSAQTYVGQIGDPDVDHAYWGRPEQETTARPAYVYDKSTPAADLLGAVSAALASSSQVFKADNATYAAELVQAATELYTWGAAVGGKYSDFYKKQTASIYPSSDFGQPVLGSILAVQHHRGCQLPEQGRPALGQGLPRCVPRVGLSLGLERRRHGQPGPAAGSDGARDQQVPRLRGQQVRQGLAGTER